MMMSNNTSTLVEIESGHGEYDMPYQIAIIEHPHLGRLLLTQSMTGLIGSIQGGAYRWATAYCLLPGDTLADLRAGEWNDAATLLAAVMGGHDATRPMLRSYNVGELAVGAGL